MNTHFVLRKNYVDRNGLQQIQLIYCANSKQGRIDTGIRIRLKDWNESKELILSSVSEINQNSKTLNAVLVENKSKILTIVNGYKRVNETSTSASPDPDPDYVKIKFNEKIKEIKEERPMVDHLKTYIEDKKGFLDTVYDGLNKDKRSGQYKTISHYEILYNDLIRFSVKNRKTYYFCDIDKKFKNDLIKFYLDKGSKKEKKKGLSNSTLKKKFTTFKAFLKEMTQDGVNKKLDYISFSLLDFKEAGNDDNIYALTIKEFNKFINIPLNLPNIEIVRDYYLLSCTTGLRWSDVSRLTKSNIKNGNIMTSTIKGKKSVIIPLNPISESILKKYNYLLPEISKTEVDRRLKLMWVIMSSSIPTLKEDTSYKYFIGTEMIEETYKKYELLTFHTSRKYFISYLIHKQVTPDQIKNFTGHSGRSLNVFYRYVSSGNFDPEEHKNLFTESKLFRD